MVDLVLDAASQKARHFEPERLPIEIHPLHDDLLGAVDVCGEPGDGEAPLLGPVRPSAMSDDRVDDRAGLLVGLTHVHNEKTGWYADLWGGEADPLRAVHSLEHLGGQLPKLVVYFCNLFGTSA